MKLPKLRLRDFFWLALVAAVVFVVVCGRDYRDYVEKNSALVQLL